MARARDGRSTRCFPRCSTPAANGSCSTSGRDYTEFLEQGCDGALLVGMHARAGTANGVLNHTVSGSDWHNLWFNETLVGETGINAALCGTWGCPVLMVSGDDATCREGVDLLGEGIVTVAVKQGLGRFSARHLPLVRARELLEDGARRAVEDRGSVEPYDPGRPCEIVVEYTKSNLVEAFRNREGIEILEPRKIVSRADDWWTAWQQFWQFSH